VHASSLTSFIGIYIINRNIEFNFFIFQIDVLEDDAIQNVIVLQTVVEEVM